MNINRYCGVGISSGGNPHQQQQTSGFSSSSTTDKKSTAAAVSASGRHHPHQFHQQQQQALFVIKQHQQQALFVKHQRMQQQAFFLKQQHQQQLQKQQQQHQHQQSLLLQSSPYHYSNAAASATASATTTTPVVASSSAFTTTSTIIDLIQDNNKDDDKNDDLEDYNYYDLVKDNLCWLIPTESSRDNNKSCATAISTATTANHYSESISSHCTTTNNREGLDNMHRRYNGPLSQVRNINKMSIAALSKESRRNEINIINNNNIKNTNIHNNNNNIKNNINSNSNNTMIANLRQPDHRQHPQHDITGFPSKLHDMLDDADKKNGQYSHIISWCLDGKSFMIKQPGEDTPFVNIILKKYFRQTKYKSFLRQLQGYCFRRITSGTLKGLCSHPLFQRGRRSLLLQCSNNSESNSILPPSLVMPMRSSVMYNTRKNSTSENHIKIMMIKYGRAYNKQVKNNGNGNGIHTNNSSTSSAPSSTSAPSSRSRNICGVDYYDNQSNDINNSINSTNSNFVATAVDAATAMVIGNSNDINLLHDNKRQNNNIAVNAINEIMTKERKEDDNNNKGSSSIHSSRSSSNINNVNNNNNNNDEKMMNNNNDNNNGNNNYDEHQDDNDNENNQQDNEGEDEDDDCQHDYMSLYHMAAAVGDDDDDDDDA